MDLELQEVEPLVVPQASPTRERSPDVISSASTAMSQDIPEIASETLQRSFAAPAGLPAEVLEPHADSMASAASALHLLSPRNRHGSEHGHHTLDMAAVEVDRLNAPSLLETALTQESTAPDSVGTQPWPAAPDITRETRNSMADRWAPGRAAWQRGRHHVGQCGRGHFLPGAVPLHLARCWLPACHQTRAAPPSAGGGRAPS